MQLRAVIVTGDRCPKRCFEHERRATRFSMKGVGAAREGMDPREWASSPESSWEGVTTPGGARPLEGRARTLLTRAPDHLAGSLSQDALSWYWWSAGALCVAAVPSAVLGVLISWSLNPVRNNESCHLTDRKRRLDLLSGLGSIALRKGLDAPRVAAQMALNGVIAVFPLLLPPPRTIPE